MASVLARYLALALSICGAQYLASWHSIRRSSTACSSPSPIRPGARVIRRLGRGPTSVGELAGEFPMTLPSFMKHVRTLESERPDPHGQVGRVRTCVLNRDRLALVDDWLAEQRRIWEDRTDRLEQFRHRFSWRNQA